MTPGQRATLEAARAKEEAALAEWGLRDAACQGYHPVFGHRAYAGKRHATARFLALREDGAIDRLCARCAYGLDAADVVGRLPLRYPAGDGA